MLNRAVYSLVFGALVAASACKDNGPERDRTYDIVLRYFGDPLTNAQKALFENAAARLEAIIVGDVIDARSDLDLAVECAAVDTLPNGTVDTVAVAGLPTVKEEIDDIVIYASIDSIDGTGTVLGVASPCVGRNAEGEPVMVAYGYMKFDEVEFGSLANPQEIVLHEMLHVLGFGTIWGIDRQLVSGKGGGDPRFLGQAAKDACIALGGAAICATGVPLENTGEQGTRDAHWRESVFSRELMTGFYNLGVNPLSAMTIASMQDLGFEVNMAAADDYALPLTGVARLNTQTTLHHGWERIGRLRGRLRSDGSVQEIRHK